MTGNTLPDVQALADPRGIALERAGIDGLRMPMVFADSDGSTQSSVAMVCAWATVGANERGTHMSRLAEAAGTWQSDRLALSSLPGWLAKLAKRMDSTAVGTSIDFPLFLRRPSPVSGLDSWLDIQVRMQAEHKTDANTSLCLELTVPVKMLCPCSKEIASAGAHTQRAQITVRLWLPRSAELSILALAQQIELQGSARLDAVLKRADEKHVTEQAYANALFAEDACRNVVTMLTGTGQNWIRWQVNVSNQESIHNHQAFAMTSSASASDG